MKEFIYLFKAGALRTTNNMWLNNGRIAIILTLMLLCCSIPSIANDQGISSRTRIYMEEISSDSVLLKFDNRFAVPVSVRLILELNNLHSVGNKIDAVIPAGSAGHIIAKFRRTNPNAQYQCSYNWRIVLGDVTRQPDLRYAYGFPYLKGGKYRISQGPGGHISHLHFFAYDFVMPLGTPVTASRDGVIAFVKENSDKGGPDRKFIEDANYISVYHADGTMANYFHLKKNGAAVKEGQYVKKGDVIGFSGNTGFSNGAHLHFEVIRPDLDSDENSSVAFLWEEQDDIHRLAGKKTPFSIFGRRM